MRPVGNVAQLWCYPVKSMLGERCETLSIEAHGVAGDRLFAIHTPDGRLGSGKNSSRFRKIDGLFRFAAAYRDEALEVYFPDGEIVSGDDAHMGARLSAALDRPLTLVREAAGAHLDAAPVHLLSSGSLDWLHAMLPDAGIDERRFRPNLVIEVSEHSPVERTWLGRRLRIGDELELVISEGTRRCGMVSFAQSELARDARVLREITRQAELQFGVYAEVVTPGRVRANAPVMLAGDGG